MYNQGSYQQFGQRLPAPPPPPLFQQGPSAPQHSVDQQGHPSIPPHVGQVGPPPYAHASSAPMQLGPPGSVPPSGMLSTSQSYLMPPLPPPPHVHGSTSAPHSYSTTSQSSSWTQNQRHISPSFPPPPPGHHLTPRLPSPHPQGQPFYRGLSPPLLPGGIQGHQVVPPLPPPPTSSYFTPVPFGSFAQPAHASNMSNLPPPPPPPPPPPSSPPPGPPPLPPSSPPPSSPRHLSSASPARAAELGPTSGSPSDVDMIASVVIDTRDRSNDDNLNCVGVNGSEVRVKDTSEFNMVSGITQPPPRPTEEKTVRRIEVLCQYIAKNGPKFEDMTCQKEAGNPEFEFLFGGEPGSEAAVAHEYFKWMKKNCSSTEVLEGRKNDDMPLRPSEDGSSLQPDDKTNEGISRSPADSDMDMEDDITPPERPGTDKSIGCTSHERVLISNDVNTTLERPSHDVEHIPPKDATYENLFRSGSSRTADKETNLSQNDIECGRSLINDGHTDSQWPSDSKAEKPNISSHHEINQSVASTPVQVSSSEVPGELIKGTSPFRLIQDYASDDSSENDNEPHLEDVSPSTVSPQVKAGTMDLDAFQTERASKDSTELNKGTWPLSASVMDGPSSTSSENAEPSTGTKGLEKEIEQLDSSRDSRAYVDGGTPMDFKQDHLAGDAGRKTGRSQKVDDATKLEVDEFGRLIKAGASESDSDDYSRRRGRGRSRSRSRSPHGRRRRSPRRRREKRSRSRSWSPKKRSRSRSPYRHVGRAGGDRTRRDRSHQPVCLDFQRGKCFRGSSCRFIHDSDKNEESRLHKNIPHRSKSYKSANENEEMQLYQDVHGSSRWVKEEFVEPAGCSAETASAPETGDATRLVSDVGIENLGDQRAQASLSGSLLQNSSDQLQQNNEHPTIPDQPSTGGHPLNQISPHLPIEHNDIPTSNLPLYAASVDIYPSYQAPPSSSRSQLSVNPLPPPPPPPPAPGVLLSQYQLPPQINYPSQSFVRPYAGEVPTHLQAGDSRVGAYLPLQEPHRPVSHTDDFRPRPFPLNYPMPPQLGPPFGEDNFARFPSQTLVSSSSFSQGNIHPQPTGRMQALSVDNMPPGGLPIPSSEGHPYLPQYRSQNPVADGISTLGEPGKINLRYPSDFPDGSRTSAITDFGRSRISTHYNPYASTFDQPLSTKFSSGVFSLEKGSSYSDKYGASIGQSHSGPIGSRNMNFTPNLPRSGGDQYDPLFDSIEPSSNSFRKSDNKPLDLEENSKRKEVAVAASTSVENDEFGETGDAEVGAVENDSPTSSPMDLPDTAAGEVEIDQVKNPGKTKKTKDSRSMKLFKVALADFVKEVLKPSWRQGNMSKEAFKTIVKKTVDKVSGAMKKHQLPKSQAKINQYIDSSQRKLTKLVMGYVDKYVKV